MFASCFEEALKIGVVVVKERDNDQSSNVFGNHGEKVTLFLPKYILQTEVMMIQQSSSLVLPTFTQWIFFFEIMLKGNFSMTFQAMC